ncbi:MAG TPA: hypothetical protein VHC00_14070 [Rhizobiaceae bacterium]|jgi:hypothetical protein|nr:hypothetical protein [Rhizobiaceae bacterium]
MKFHLRAIFPLAALLAAAGCTSTGSALNVQTPSSGNAMAATVPSATPANGTTAAAAAPSAAQLAAIAPKTHIQFAPIIGATTEAVGPLSQRLAADAKTDGISIVPANTKGATHILKGYFSAFTEGPKTTVVYVWDVLDPSGNRLHRIEGQEVTTGGKGAGWASVSPALMEKIADDTMKQFTTWLVNAKA